MATRDQKRLFEDRTNPRILTLWWALQPLRSVIRFMQSGAHPDDETSPMMAALAFRDGVNISYACSTRGEGGQNVIGTEAGAALGALRTREMERACDVLGMRMYWHSETPADPITDFGFSKSGADTLETWGHARTLARFVEILRTERPDILCPTFLDVPGQHGHHRAMTQAAHEVMTAAADPEFPSNLPPWQVAKLYLPAWSGAGQAYDDDLPPPPATLTINGDGRDPISGWSWTRIGEQSRAFHRTQGMGHWPSLAERPDWPLHLAMSFVRGPDDSLASGLPRTLADLAETDAATPISADLKEAQTHIDAAIGAFPEFPVVADAAARALTALRRAISACPIAARNLIAHRLAAKEQQLSHVLRLALGTEARGGPPQNWLTPGTETDWLTEVFSGDAEIASATPALPDGWNVVADRLRIASDARPDDPYRAEYDPLSPPAPALDVSVTHKGVSATSRIALDPSPVLLPGSRADLTPDRMVSNRARAAHLPSLRLSPETADIDLPEGWEATKSAGEVTLHLPETVSEGLYSLPITQAGAPANAVRRIAHDHIRPTSLAAPAILQLRVLSVQIPDVRVGYVGGGNDRVGHWLGAIGADVTELGDDDLGSDAALDRVDTIVAGIFTMKSRPALADAMGRIHKWIARGGTLVTLYHRPWDAWDPDTTPPRRLEIGQPSLRWRVTDETAEIRHIADHPLLNTPNRIGPDTWHGWVKERGLYFARSWDDAYVPLIELADPGETPHKGALLCADVGAGRHVHTSLILHHQMEHLVPGAFALMANMIARRR